MIETPNFLVRASPRLSRAQVESLAREHELHAAELRAFFGRAPEGKITSFVYADAAEKGRWIGAERTQLARPWVNEVHINGAAVPHPALKHELAHLFAGTLARPPFRIPLISGVVPNIGLIEGTAVAADNPVRELTLHQWSAAMLKLQRLPDVSRSLDPTAFWALSGARAYVAFGSFIRWLIDRRGLDDFAQLYAGATFERTYGTSAAELEGHWRRFLAEVPLEASALRMAEHRFSRPTLFEKVCARSTAELYAEARARLRAGDLIGARPLLRQVWALQPADLSPLLLLARAEIKRGALPSARAIAQDALRAPGATEAARLRARELTGEIAWLTGDRDTAAMAFRELLEARLSTASLRLQAARLAILGSPYEDALRPLLTRGERPEVALVRLGALHRSHPGHALVAYLYARHLEAAKLHAVGLSAALDLDLDALPHPALRAEARLLAARLALGAERWGLAADIGAAVAHNPAFPPAVTAEAERGLRRARWRGRHDDSTGPAARH